MEKILKVSKSVVDFVNNAISFVEENKVDLNMEVYVARFDRKKNCGTICCVYGWLPAWHSDFKWDGNFVEPSYLNFIQEKLTDEKIFFSLNFSVYIGSSFSDKLEKIGIQQQTAVTIEDVRARFELLKQYTEIIPD